MKPGLEDWTLCIIVIEPCYLPNHWTMTANEYVPVSSLASIDIVRNNISIWESFDPDFAKIEERSNMLCV